MGCGGKIPAKIPADNSDMSSLLGILVIGQARKGMEYILIT